MFDLRIRTGTLPSLGFANFFPLPKSTPGRPLDAYPSHAIV